jgi:hypothetical protein
MRTAEVSRAKNGTEMRRKKKEKQQKSGIYIGKISAIRREKVKKRFGQI